MKFELLVAVRYLRAKRTQTVISMITFIAIAAPLAVLVLWTIVSFAVGLKLFRWN